VGSSWQEGSQNGEGCAGEDGGVGRRKSHKQNRVLKKPMLTLKDYPEEEQ